MTDKEFTFVVPDGTEVELRELDNGSTEVVIKGEGAKMLSSFAGGGIINDMAKMMGGFMPGPAQDDDEDIDPTEFRK